MPALSTVVECSDACSAAAASLPEDPEVDYLRRARCNAYVAGALDNVPERLEPPPPPTWPPTCTILRRSNAIKGAASRPDLSPALLAGDFPPIMPMSARDMFIQIANNCAKASFRSTPPRPLSSPSGPKVNCHKKTPSRVVFSQKGLIPLRLASTPMVPSSAAPDSPPCELNLECPYPPIVAGSESIVPPCHLSPAPALPSPVISAAPSMCVSTPVSAPAIHSRESTPGRETVDDESRPLKTKKSFPGSFRGLFRRKSKPNLDIEEEKEDFFENTTLVAPALPVVPASVAAAPPTKPKKVSFAGLVFGRYGDDEGTHLPAYSGEESVRARLIEASLAEKGKERVE